jgi:hypothetical protein
LYALAHAPDMRWSMLRNMRWRMLATHLEFLLLS